MNPEDRIAELTALSRQVMAPPGTAQWRLPDGLPEQRRPLWAAALALGAAVVVLAGAALATGHISPRPGPSAVPIAPRVSATGRPNASSSALPAPTPPPVSPRSTPSLSPTPLPTPRPTAKPTPSVPSATPAPPPTPTALPTSGTWAGQVGASGVGCPAGSTGGA